jgi:hypothetical protein
MYLTKGFGELYWLFPSLFEAKYGFYFDIFKIRRLVVFP